MSEGHIFISYRSIEVDFALKLSADLKNAGVNIWMDRLDAGIKVGDDWIQSLQDALDNCGSFIAILSPDYVESKYCRRELKRADSYDRPIYPLLLRQLEDKKWPLEIQEKQFIDFRQWRDERIYQQQFENLLNVLTNQIPRQFARVPDNETQYLTSLIAELESRKGVLEYVELSTYTDMQTENEPVRPEPSHDDWAAGFSLLVDKTKNTQSDYKQNLKSISSEKIIFNSIVEVKEKFPSFMLIGEPGAGKSTTLRWLALDAARKRLEFPQIAPLPLLIYLPKWGNESTPLDLIRNHLPQGIDAAKLLAENNVSLFLDGLNEMGADRYEKAQKLTTWLESSEAPKHVFVTCRSSDYVGRMRLGEMTTLVVDEMKERQIREFAHRYLGENAELFLSRIIPNNMTEKTYARSLYKLAKNPYLLSALIFVFQNSTGSDLPLNNGELMYALVQALWERENIRQTVGWIPFKEMQEKMTNLAFAIVNESKPTDVNFDYGLKYLKDKKLIAACHSANFIIVQGKTLRFYHQIIQEFFAAFHRSIMPKRVMKIQLAIAYDKWGNKKVIIKESKWKPIIVSLCGLQQHPDGIIEDIARINPILAVDCITSGVRVNDNTVQKVIETLSLTLESLNIRNYITLKDYDLDDVNENIFLNGHNIAAVIILPFVGIIISTLLHTPVPNLFFIYFAWKSLKRKSVLRLQPEENELLSTFFRELTLLTICRLNYPESINVLFRAMTHKTRYIRRTAAKALNKMDNWESTEIDFSGSQLVTSNIYSLLNDQDANIRRSAIKVIGLLGEESAIPKIAHLLDDPSINNANARGISDLAVIALERIGTAEALTVAQKWRGKQ